MILPAMLALAQQPPIVPEVRPGVDGRGRDPWVFRALFDDRTRMVLIAPKPGFWMAFNPDTGAMHRVWEGEVDFKGKVWDFSQDNSKAKGRYLMAAAGDLVSENDTRWDAGGKASNGLKWVRGGQESWRGTQFLSPWFSTEGWHRIFVAFEEQGRGSRIRVELQREPDRKVFQWFESTTSVTSDTDWQWNFKMLEAPVGFYRLGFSADQTGKAIRNIRVFGDRIAWHSGDDQPLSVRWRGYRLIERTKGVVLRYDLLLPDGKAVQVELTPETTPTGWKEEYKVTAPAGARITLTPGWVAPSVRRSAAKLEFTGSQIQTLVHTVEAAAR